MSDAYDVGGRESPALARSSGPIVPAQPIEALSPGPGAVGEAISHKELIGRYVILAAFDLAAKLCGFGATVAIVKHFGAAGFGAVSFAQQVAVYGLIGSTCGLDLHAIKSAVGRPAELGTIAGTVIALRLGLSLPCYAVLLVSASLVPPAREVLGLIALFGLTLFSGALSLIWVAQATQRTHVLGLANLCIQVVYLGLISLGIRLRLGEWSVPTALLCAEMLVAVTLVVWMTRGIDRLWRPMGWQQSLQFLRRAAPLGGSQLLRTLAIGSDIVLVGLLLTIREVGLYSAAYKIFTVGISLSAVYFVVLFPHFARHAVDSTDALRRELRTSLARVLALTVPVLSFGAWMAGNVLQTLYTPSFAVAETTLRILLLVIVIALVNGHLRHGLIVLGRQRQDLRNVAESSVVHVGMKLVLIPILGMEGAALGTLFGETVLMVRGWTAMRAIVSDPGAGLRLDLHTGA